MSEKSDIWNEWLRHRRFSDDSAIQTYAMEEFKKQAMRIVDKAEIPESATVLDIGAGDGLVGLHALPRLGSHGKLILSDISESALKIPKEIFNQKKIEDSRVEFLIAGVEDLSALQNGSVDRVLGRAVILYIENKQSAFNEIFRILRKGGRAVLMEPINQRQIEIQRGYFLGYKLDREPLLSVRPLLEKIRDEAKIQDSPGTLVGYNEHDLVQFSTTAGFEEVKLEYTLIRTSRARQLSWKAFFDTAPNPRSPTPRELITKVLTHEEFEEVERALKKVIQQPSVRSRSEALLILEK